MSMTREELRQWFAEWLEDYYDELHTEDDLTPEVAESVLVALRTPTIAPQDELLTIEQLRQMDGQPVWIVDVGNRKWYGPSWAIVDREANLVRTVKNWNAVFFEKYGERWIAYRRPPERQEDL